MATQSTTGTLRRYGAAILLVCMAGSAKASLTPIIGTESPFLLFFTAVVLSAWYGGLGPGLMATGLSAAISNIFFLAPFTALSGALDQQARLGIFVVESILITVICAQLHGAQSQATTNRKTATQSEEQFRLLVESVTDYAIFMLSSDGYIVSWNPGAERMKGYRADEIIGQSYNRFFLADDVLRGKPQRILAHAAETGKTIDEGWRVRKDGSTFWANAVITSIRDADGNLRGFAKVTRDITERRRADQEREAMLVHLEAEQAWLEAVLEQSPVGVILVGAPAGQLLRSNHQANLLWGREIQTWDGVQPGLALQGFHADGQAYQPDEWPLIRALQQGEIVKAEEINILRSDGTMDIIQSSAAPIRDPAGHIVAGVGIFLDVTKQRQAEVSLHQTQASLQAILDWSPAVIYVKDIEGHYLLINRHFETLFHLSPDEVLGRTDYQLFDTKTPLFQNHDRDVLAANEPMEWEEIIVQDDGAHTYLSLKFPLRHNNGTPYAVCSISTDISMRKEIEAKNQALLLREQQARRQAETAQRRIGFLADVSRLLVTSFEYRAILEQVANTVIPFLADACLADILDPDETLSNVVVAHGDPTIQAHLQRWRQQNISPDARGPNPIETVRRTGAPILLATIPPELQAALLPASSKQSGTDRVAFQSLIAVPLKARERLLGIMTFLTHAKQRRAYRPADLALAQEVADRVALAVDNAQLFQEVQTSLEARDQFLSTASHELKTPITSLQGYADLLLRRAEREGTLPPRDQRSVRHIHEQTMRLAKLVELLLDFSRIQLGRLSIEQHPLDLVPVVQHVVAYVQPSLKQHPLRLIIPDEPVLVGGDEARLEQVIWNLLHNAIKYSPEGGTITISLTIEAQKAQLMLIDEGIGMSSEALKHLFDPFHRAHHSHHYAYIQGLGLGLAVVKEIVMLHGGRIDASSGEGEGSCFIVTLPLLTEGQVALAENRHPSQNA